MPYLQSKKNCVHYVQDRSAATQWDTVDPIFSAIRNRDPPVACTTLQLSRLKTLLKNLFLVYMIPPQIAVCYRL